MSRRRKRDLVYLSEAEADSISYNLQRGFVSGIWAIYDRLRIPLGTKTEDGDNLKEYRPETAGQTW